MTADKIAVSFACPECGGSSLSLPSEYSDEAITECGDCGRELGRLQDIKSQALHAAINTLRVSLGSPLIINSKRRASGSDGRTVFHVVFREHDGGRKNRRRQGKRAKI